MPTDTDKKLNGAPEPFRRPVVWGRPPATVFRAGPLPKGERLPPLPEPPRAGSAAGILNGSMIPRATPPAPALKPVDAPAPRPPEPREAPAPTPAARAAFVDHAADLTVRPLPEPEPEPDLETVTPNPALQLDALPAFHPAAGGEAVRKASPDPTTRPAPMARATGRKPANRVPLYAGIAAAAVTVLALGGWIWTRSPAEAPVMAAPPPPVTAPLAPATDIPALESPPVPTVAETASGTPGSAAPAPVTNSAEPPPTVARTPPPAVTRPAPPASEPEPVVPPPAVVTAPLIEIVPAPSPGPAPTAAERPQADPDAPIATRPQPLD